ncbi:hypothetical protein ACFRQM_07960 [Streptomyces sp. NPDC056831]|uniref:hypothetical protein n=1 Tax=Streptomyces sp. NPDC056831 TaxID=3345954 RepID=UPI0036B566A7
MVYAHAITHLGEVALSRLPAERRSHEAKAEKREEWIIDAGKAGRILVPEFGSPGLTSIKILRNGTRGSLDGVDFKVTVKSSCLHSRRRVEFDGIGIHFEVRRFGVDLHRGGRRVARRILGEWNFFDDAAPTVLGACLFEWGGMDFFLRTPFLRLL